MHTFEDILVGRVKATQTQTNSSVILAKLKGALNSPSVVKIRCDPFETLVVTIISQNTADINTARAFQNLSGRFPITPQALASAPVQELEACLRVGGLYKGKAQTIQTASRIILEKFQGSLKYVLSLPLAQTREMLMEMPGVGPKTADVVLLFSANQPTIPVDTHVNRVSKRLGLAPKDGGYEEVRLALQQRFEPKDFLAVHLLLIALGRKFCKARRPLCVSCPVNSHCPSMNAGNRRG
jgi:endonuclease-3